jgi:hypothetical protein
MSNEVTNAPSPPGKDPLTPGIKTSEFYATGAGMFLSTLFTLLAAFNTLHISEQQRQAIYEFSAVSWIALPVAYSFGRSFVKGRAVSSAAAPPSSSSSEVSIQSR